MKARLRLPAAIGFAGFLAVLWAAREWPAAAPALAVEASPEEAPSDRPFWRGWRLLLASDPAEPPPPPTAPPPAVAVPAEVGTDEEEQRLLLRALGREVLSPAYAGFESAAGRLADEAVGRCGAGGNVALRRAWREAMTAWQRVQHFRAGPVEEANRRLRIHWFPDSNNAVERGLRQWLRGSQAITQAAIASTSAGAQGLPALEQLIFAAEPMTAGSRSCLLTAAIADNLHVMADAVAQPWGEGGATLEGFVTGGAPFLGPGDVLVALFEAIVVQAEFIADRKIGPALRLGEASVLESPLAMHSRENLAANVEALQALAGTGEDNAYRLYDYLERAHGEGALAAELADLITRLQQQLAGLEDTLEGVVGKGDTEPLSRLRAGFRELRQRGEEAAIAAGVNLGFNSEDGD